ncbi:uncharacterized protein C8Q71DRAFT_440086 [Rhodofomes roseus]|uniref:MYND-type domain-containing protein n=1 Tax=Rhodofomes roseus TaxID=34475 RepID=A0ABQ8KTG1_9APHY|nr:uncharacterized protein C8Q71DRAFT_440086 [Rhodofomes roseus]KAH9841121.1 hypothetical protein C8Q71DRAFT_440086 [Rhodofomes roseus]
MRLRAASYTNATLTLGRHHASWFLMSTDSSSLPACPLICLNFIPPDITPLSPSMRTAQVERFLYHGGPGGPSLLQLLSLQDESGRPILKLTGESVGSKHIVEVLVSEADILHACAHCGMWEPPEGDRFTACDACKVRYYCSELCQKEDSREDLHGTDCLMLQQGRELDVERRRKLHDNFWNLKNRKDHSTFDPTRIKFAGLRSDRVSYVASSCSACTLCGILTDAHIISTSPPFSLQYCKCHVSGAA